jgi:hypothetical protein
MRLPHKSTQAPQVTLAIAPVIALARSEAMIVAAFATSASSDSRRSKVPLPFRLLDQEATKRASP